MFEKVNSFANENVECRMSFELGSERFLKRLNDCSETSIVARRGSNWDLKTS